MLGAKPILKTKSSVKRWMIYGTLVSLIFRRAPWMTSAADRRRYRLMHMS